MSVAPDSGEADPALLAALATGDMAQAWTVLQGARLLIGVVAIPGSEHSSEGEMALALLEAGTGERALPAFTGLAALSAWNPDARPVPRSAVDIVAYAAAEGLAAVVIDPGSPHACTLLCERP